MVKRSPARRPGYFPKNSAAFRAAAQPKMTLRGQTVLVTRPEVGSAEDPLAHRFREWGAQVLVQPAIQITNPPDWAPVDEALARLVEFDWAVFSSASGVRFFLQRLTQLGGDARRFQGVKLAVIGPGTAEALAEYGLRADLVPGEFRAEALAHALAPAAAGQRFLLIRASRGREVLRERLQAAGASVEQVVAYSSTDVEKADPQITSLLAAGKIDWVTVTSSSIAAALVHLFGDLLRRTRLASISPVTSAALRELGYPPTVEARDYTLSGLASAVLEAVLESM
jgi:uroporphyrinogen III methyltransferase/synthase